MMPTRDHELVTLTTGASSGIGEALAHCFAAAGHPLVLVNNAGVLAQGSFAAMPPASSR